MTYSHTPVLLKEAVDSLEIKPGNWYIDGTAGGGGHTSEILKTGGKVIAVDRDDEAIKHLTNIFGNREDVLIVKENFAKIDEVAKRANKKISGILLDLGYSSNQIEASGRGFSFMRDEKLDMRMDTEQSLTAEFIVNEYPRDELTEIFLRYGEEEESGKVADVIVQKRKKARIESTKELAELVASVKRGGHIHPATKVFQALRIAVNNELENVRTGIDRGIEVLDSGGRLSVITFHSIEDRIVKEAFIDFKSKRTGTIITKKPIVPSFEEVKKNRRSRSSKLRVIEKI